MSKAFFKALDSQMVKVNKFFAGAKSLNSTNFRNLLIGIIIAFGVLIFFLTTVDFSKIKVGSSLSSSEQPPPPPPDVITPPEPPAEIFSQGAVYGETSKSPPCYFPAGGPTTDPIMRGYGDINGDGQVTNEDAGLTVSPSTLSSIQKKAGDVMQTASSNLQATEL